ncbi:MAG: hypothetical protein WC096_06305 [Sphaerochaetaceae bacterium]|jgi:hypothetical protein
MKEPLLLSLFDKVSWYPFSDEAMIQSHWYMPRLCDPCFLFPDQSPDGKWHLFAHTWVGLEHFTSANGIWWEPLKMIEFRGHSPSVYYEGGMWYLLYEKHDKLFQRFSRRTKEARAIETSRIEMRSSSDLVLFSEPKILLDATNVSFAKDGLRKARISRPQVFKENGSYRLYFGASHIVLDDSKQKASRYFAMATSSRLEGPYTHERILLRPGADDPFRNMATGSVRVVQMEDGFAAFACPFSWDRVKGRTHSSLVLYTSADGISFRPLSPNPVLLTTPQRGWASRYVTSCDIRYKADEQCWYCYFSANEKHVFNSMATEAIGLLLGKDPTLRKFPAIN